MIRRSILTLFVAALCGLGVTGAELDDLEFALIGGVAVAFGTSQIVPAVRGDGPIVASAISIVRNGTIPMDTLKSSVFAGAASRIGTVLGAFQRVVGPLSDSRALTDAFKSYFAYKSAHPDQVRKPFLYFVDYQEANVVST